MVGIAATIGLVYLFEQVLHGMGIQAPTGATLKPPAAAALLLEHHGETLLAMLIGGLLAMLAAMTVSDTQPRALALTVALGPIPMLASMALAGARGMAYGDEHADAVAPGTRSPGGLDLNRAAGPGAVHNGLVPGGTFVVRRLLV
jgi:hypothetical protein